MNATPPEASTEYSKGVVVPRDRRVARGRGDSATESGRRQARGGGVAAAILAATLISSLLLLVAEFTTLFEVRTATGAVTSTGTGSHHGYALVPIALLAAVMGYAVWAAGSRPALIAIGVLGVLALLIALLGDLPDASANGLVTRAAHYVPASSRPSAGFYMETLGGVVLVIACVSGLVLIGLPTRGDRREPSAELSGS